jgi:hypothetical protein
LHGHHIQHWLHGGETSVANLALLCTFHHHLVHEGGWTIARGENGELAFSAPDGRALAAEPPRQVVDDVRCSRDLATILVRRPSSPLVTPDRH